MKKIFIIFLAFPAFFACNEISTKDKTLEPFKYFENFESNELNAWADYPFCQDGAYDPYLRPDKIIPGDSNISFVLKSIPHTHVDDYAGAEKKLDAFLVPGSYIKFRYYLKTQLKPEFLKVRLAAGPMGQLDYTLANPRTNRWEDVKVTFNGFLKQNPDIKEKKIRIHAVAMLVKIPKADPAMPVYLGLDDIEISALRKIEFHFSQPGMDHLAEWKPYIPKKHYRTGELFTLKGTWPVKADRVTLKITPFTHRQEILLNKELHKDGDTWGLDFKLSFPQGLYLATLEAYKNEQKLSDTQFTVFIQPDGIAGQHPRLWFDDAGAERVTTRLMSNRFKNVRDKILSEAKNLREKNPVDSIVFDIDQFPGADIDPTYGLENIVPWFKRITAWKNGVYYNALAYKLLGDKQAGSYAKDLMVKISGFPFWVHPWWIGRGQHIYYPVGELGMAVSLGYDLTYDVMNEDERATVREALMKQIVKACHKGYVEDNLVINNTSNWIAHITGGSMMSQAAMYGDDPAIPLEPYFTGVIFKAYEMIQKSFTSDGSYGEGYGYYSFTMLSLSKSLPAMDNVFSIDMSDKIKHSYEELIWSGNIKKKKTYYFGDSGGDLRSLTNWAWLLAKHKNPLLGWFYNFLHQDETFMDVLYETKNVEMKDPFNENPVRFFRGTGTTVFKSGWGKDDFIFAMRTGAFFNHQHLDQGTFWLSDHGSLFIGERHGSTYYLDPYYQSWYIQPVAHSTILIDHNHQSQRVGDPLAFAKGFEDHAFLYHFLDGSNAAFSCGDIGRLYWGKVKQIRRNALYLKPRTVLLLDVIVPAAKDVDVTQLYQAHYLKDIQPGSSVSTVTRGKNTLYIEHLYPENIHVEKVETPHYIYTLMNEDPLIKEGMLTVTANTIGRPLVMASVLTSTTDKKPDLIHRSNKGCVSGTVNGRNFIFSTQPGNIYKSEGFDTDAQMLTWDGSKTFAAIVKTLKKDGKLLISSEIPLTCEISGKLIKYYHREKAGVIIGIDRKPTSVILNGEKVTEWSYNDGSLTMELPAGEGTIVMN